MKELLAGLAIIIRDESDRINLLNKKIYGGRKRANPSPDFALSSDASNFLFVSFDSTTQTYEKIRSRRTILLPSMNFGNFSLRRCVVIFNATKITPPLSSSFDTVVEYSVESSAKPVQKVWAEDIFWACESSSLNGLLYGDRNSDWRRL